MCRTIQTVLLSLIVTSVAPECVRAAAPVRYLIYFPGNSVPPDLADSVLAAKGRVVRAFPPLGIAIAVSASPDFTPLITGRLGLPRDSVGSVPLRRLPVASQRRHARGPTAADELYTTGALWGIRRVRADMAWKAGFTGSHKTVVAVIDTGVAWNHPDLRPNVVLAKCISSRPACNPYPAFSDHGTHVAGIIAAAFGGGSAVGVGPNLGIASYNIFEEVPECGVCSYDDSRWAAMIDAASRGFSVLNISQGATYMLRREGANQVAAFRNAEKRVLNYVQNAGTLVVASAGNGTADLSGPVLHLPGDTAGYVNVGATAIRPLPRYPTSATYDVRAYYSNYGAPLTVSAPGGDCGVDIDCDPILDNWFEYMILSTVVAADPICAETADCPIGYDWKSGTSMAAAHVSGAAGLIRDARRELKPEAVTALLKSSADSAGARLQFGHGIVNVFEALKQATRPK